MADWIWLRNTDTGGVTRVADEPGVVDWHTSRGWEPTIDPPTPRVFVPDPSGGPVDAEWVEVRHAETGGVQLLPNDPAALADAADKGWHPAEPSQPEPSEPAAPAEEDESDEE